VLTGKYRSGTAAGRAAGALADPGVAAAVAAAEELARLAGRLDTTAAALAIAFPLTNPDVTSVLFGATSAEQVRANGAAISLLDRLTRADLVQLRGIGLPSN
jgi:L-glyceraldehyde 3-phosphate reductase